MRSISNRDYVIKVASDLFLVQGVSCISMDEVARRSGVSKSNIYYHFKSKDELTQAVLEYFISALQSHFQEQVLAGKGALLPRLEGYINQLIDELIERECEGGCPLISLMVEAGKTDEDVRQRLAKFFQQQAQVIAGLFDEGKQRGEIRSDLPAHALASLITSWLEGSLMLASIQKSASSLREERDTLFRLLAASS
ncbi:TetR/AcrR family transcriptional regulator [Ktedonosporobacter rubrisoli]|uniref:TetR/AcrR family transcriptional regulator n=1 Tax=Ktedonosporobacter rubrisoli TaxID=2509675 RepID=A0A4P6JNX1_KTERU|nr:TetR/AcrR family transcriptional regulator [Ktedonosporobacter rubrisoli]QBD76436.1 TetR/AcrR family transcriptional regulator [Ktedonosporobacter rubrisoli]